MLDTASGKLIYVAPDALYLDNLNGNFVRVQNNICTDIAVIESQYEEYLKIMGINTIIYQTAGGSFDGTKIQSWNDAAICTQTLIPNFSGGSNYFLMTDFSSGNVCAPTAATNMIWYWANDRNRAPALYKISGLGRTAAGTRIFNIMKSGMLTSVTSGTLDSTVLWGYQSYFDCDARCDSSNPSYSTWNYRYLETSSYFSSYKAAIDDGCPIHLMLRMANTVTAAGHDVFCIGYARNSSNQYYYAVMDGWYRYGRYIKNGSYPYIKGYKIWVST